MIDRRNIANLYQLSSLQEGMLYHALREPESRAYFEQIDFEIAEALDIDAYRQAWQDLVNRHDILRTVFAVRKLPQPLQIVLRNAPLEITQQDLHALPENEAQTLIARYREDDLARGFDLTEAVPMRLALFALCGERYRVVWSFHHILLDGWSLAILQSDLDALYAARLSGRSAALPPPAPYSAYIKWLGKRERQAGLAFWQTRLQGFDLPTPVPRKLEARFLRENPPYAVGECRHPLSAAAHEALPQLAAQHGVTVNIVVQCLWGLLLGRLNGRRDAAFAATVSGRPTELEEAGRTVGLFINAVPVRVKPRDGESFAALLGRVHAEAIEAQAFHDCPLAEVQAAHPLRDALFDHILVFENYPQLDREAKRKDGTAVNLHEYTHYNFEFQFLPGTPSVLRFRFHTGLFDAASMARIAEDFEALLLAAQADPHEAVSQLALPSRRWKLPAKLAIAASFTAEPIAEALAWWLAQFACGTEVELAPYNQCVQQLGDPASVLAQADLGVLLLRFADAARDLQELSEDEARASLDAQCDMLLSLLRQRAGKPLLVGLLPVAPDDGPLAAHCRLLEQRWHTELETLPGVSLLDLRDPGAEHGLEEVFDPAADRIGHLPYSPQTFDVIAAGITRAVAARARPPFKVIAVDCDNTLWAGVCGEAGPLGVQVDDGHRTLQAFLLDRQRNGFLIALASKNQEQDVWAVFEQNPNMLLRREHIAAAAINWLPKSGNLKQLAATLNLGVDSIIFIDDSLLECTEVMENCPQALALALPAEQALFAPWLQKIWAFDVTAVTAEDRERTGMIQAEAQRQAMLGAADPQAFLAQLQLKVKIGPVQPHQVARVAQLTQRTNQFNLSGVRRDDADIAALIAEPGITVLAIEVDDRFGAYGLTGVAILRRLSHALQIETLLLSCRVLGRRVEHALLSALARRAQASGLTQLEARLVRTERNEPVRLFLSGAPWQHAGEDRYTCAARDAAREIDGVELLDDHVFVPAETPIVPVARSGTGKPAETPAVHPGREHALPFLQDAFQLPIRNEANLAHRLQYLPLLAARAGWPRVGLRASGPGASAKRDKLGARPPAPGSEQHIAAIWAEVLGCEVRDAESSFTELGGHSLHAVRAVSRLERTFGRELGLAQFFKLNSVAALATWFDSTAAHTVAIATAAIRPAPDAADYPLSHNQQRLWILSRMGAADNAYNLCAAFRLRGALDAAALQRAAQRMLDRHEALRTVFRLGDAPDRQPRQVVLSNPPASFTLFAEGRQEETVRAQIVARSRRPFDLETGPLFCIDLHALNKQDHVLAIYLHHIIGDGWSFGLLLDDLAQAYAHETGHASTKEQPAALRYRDFSVWNRSPECEAGLVPQRDYWRAQLLPLAPIAQIPTDYARPAAPGGDGATVTRTLPLAALQTWLKQRNANLFPLLASLVSLLLYRCGNESTVRLGMPVAGRDRPELERTVGFFANTAVLVNRLSDEDSFETLLGNMQQRVTGALEHQAWPFDRLVADAQPEREAGRNPLFDVMVVLQNARRNAAELPGLTVEDFEADTGLAAFDLVFEFGEVEQRELACVLRYRSDLYRADTAARLLDRLLTLLDAVLAQPAAKLRELQMTNAQERAQLAAFCSGGTMPIPDRDLPALFAEQAARTPQAPAVAAGNVRLDYRTLDQRANALAWHLRRDCGVREGHVVGVLLEREIDWPIALLGILKAGAVYLPLDVRHPPGRLRDLLRQSGARMLIAAESGHADFAGLGLRAISPLDANVLQETAPPVDLTGSSPAYLIFTSGSTGTPKGVRVQHRAFVNMIREQIRSFAITPQDTVLHIASCAFDASLSEFFMAWLCGAGVALADHAGTRDGALLAALIRAHGATVATFTPSHLRQLDDAEIAGLRTIILAGEAVLGRDARRVLELGINCFNAYGPTETAVCATLARVIQAPADAAPVPIGRPLANLSLHIVDTAGRDAPLGIAGEIVVSGAGVALGYLNAEGNTAFFTRADGSRAYRTGDSGRWLADGQVEYLGRKDAQLKIRGHRIEPGEIAVALTALEGVRQAEVIAEEGAAGAYLAAYLCGEPQPDAVMRARLAQSLPAHMLPARFVWLERLPLTTSGKLDRAALPSLEPVKAGQSCALNTLESTLLALWREMLPGAIDADTDFFAAGGNSLLAMGLARRIAQQLERPCPALQFFKSPTVRSMAAALSASSSETAALIQTLGSGGLSLFALPPDPAFGLAYASLSHVFPEARIHAAQFVDKAVPELLNLYLDAFDKLGLGADTVLLGYSAGGKLALALADALAKRGRMARAVFLIDTWDWSQAAPEIRERIDAEMNAALPAAMHALSSAYRTRMALFEPATTIALPVHHLLADAGSYPLPAGVSRDWSGLAAAGYHEHTVAGSHHQVLDAAHASATAECLRDILARASRRPADTPSEHQQPKSTT